jgi:copper chaperone
MMSEVFTVKGMSCGHCAGVLAAGIEELPGVREVAVDLRNGQVTITSDHPLDSPSVHSTIERAGYKVTVGRL